MASVTLTEWVTHPVSTSGTGGTVEYWPPLQAPVGGWVGPVQEGQALKKISEWGILALPVNAATEAPLHRHGPFGL